MPMRWPEPGGAHVYVIGPWVVASARSAASVVVVLMSERKIVFAGVVPDSRRQPRSTPLSLPFAIRSHSVTTPPSVSEVNDVPARVTMLYSLETPREGGQTRFANMYAAYDALSEGLQRTLAGMRAKHSNRHLYGPEGFYRKTDLARQL